MRRSPGRRGCWSNVPGRTTTCARRSAPPASSGATLWDARERQLLRRYRDGDAGIPAYAEDYAFLIFGLLELFQADGDPAWLEWANDLQGAQDERFWDEADGGWFSTSGDDPAVLLRLKEDYDGAEPSAERDLGAEPADAVTSDAGPTTNCGRSNER